MTGRNGEATIDVWSFVHFASGLLMGLLPIGWFLAVLLIVGYEGLEAGLRRIQTKDGGLFEYESWTNIGMDIVLGVAGYGVIHVAVLPFLPWG